MTCNLLKSLIRDSGRVPKDRDGTAGGRSFIFNNLVHFVAATE